MTTNEEQKPNSRAKTWGVGTLVVVLAVLVVIVTVSIVSPNNNDNEDTAAPAPAPETSAPPADNDAAVDTSDQGWDASIADVFGRNIKVPTNGVGNSIGKAQHIDSTQCDVDNAAKLTTQRTSGTQTVWSENLGPSEVNSGGVPVGYSRSAEAALISAANDMALFYSGGDISAEVAKARFSAPNLDDLVAQLEQGSEKDPNAEYQLAPSAFRITSCDQDRVIGDVALPMPTDATGDENAPAWTVLRLASVWEDNDWKTQIGSSPQPLEEEVTNLEGWTQWRY